MLRIKTPLRDSGSSNSKSDLTIEDLSQDNPSTLFYESPINRATRLNITFSPSENPLSCVVSPKAGSIPLASDEIAKHIIENIKTEREKLNSQCESLSLHIDRLLNNRVTGKENRRYVN